MEADVELLGFGSHFVIDGFQAEAEKLADETLVNGVLRQLAGGLEPHTTADTVCVSFFDGVSAGVVLAESYLALHTFRDRRLLSLNLFSRKNLDTQEMLTQIGEQFAVGRFESHLISRAKVFPREQGAIVRRLTGDRGYVAVRLDSSLIAR